MKYLFGIGAITAALLMAYCQRDPYREGRNLYKAHCANCHGENGEGLGALIPPLAKADYLVQYRDQLPCILRNGLNDTIVVNGTAYSDQPMPANGTLSDIQICNILNFVQHSWDNSGKEYNLEEVKNLLNTCGK